MKMIGFFLIMIALVFTSLSKVSAQTYQGDLAGTADSFIYLGGNTTYGSGSVPTGTGTLLFTIDPVASTFQLDSVIYNNLVLPQISTTYPVGSGNQATVTITFNPLSFVFNPPPSSSAQPNPVLFNPISGYQVPTYGIEYNAASDLSDLNLTGSYTITSPVGSTTGTFSDPLTFANFGLGAAFLQLNGYPSSVNLFGSAGLLLKLNEAVSTTLFTATLNGTTISPSFEFAQEDASFGSLLYGSNGTTFPLVTPEPSTWAMLLGGLGLLTFWRLRARLN